MPNNRASKDVREKKNNRTTKRNKWIHYYSWRHQHFSIRNGQIWQVENQLRTHLNSKTINQLISTSGVCNYFIQQLQKYTFFSNLHGISTKIDHILGHKTYFWKLKKQKSHNVCFQNTVECRKSSANWEIYTMNEYARKEEISKIYNLSFHLRKLKSVN